MGRGGREQLGEVLGGDEGHELTHEPGRRRARSLGDARRSEQ